ncbi:3'-5' exonuclease [Lysinibacillus xylanilyticus]|uniref:3'-5' exonuclease n=1 Tax=Lysinibacillus xylanilyticus TaxID=582475 RepID=UPI003CFECEED
MNWLKKLFSKKKTIDTPIEKQKPERKDYTVKLRMNNPSALTPIEKRIVELQNENPNMTEEEIKATIIQEEKRKIADNVINNTRIEVIRGNPSSNNTVQQPQKNTSFRDLNIVPDSKLAYSKIRKLVPNFVVLDFETTGLSNNTDEIIQVAAVRYENFEEKEKFVTFVKPSKRIPYDATEINGISNDDVKDAPSIKEILPKLLEFLKDDVIVAHNASFDMKFLLSAMYKEEIEYRKFKAIDTLALSRKHIDFTKNHKLSTLKSFLKLNHLKSHDALHDCYVTAELYKYCYEESLVKN